MTNRAQYQERERCIYCGGPVRFSVVAGIGAPRCERCKERQEVDPNVRRTL